MNAYTRQDLSVMQAWPLERKNPRDAGEDHRVVSPLRRQGRRLLFGRQGQHRAAGPCAAAFPDIPAVFVDTGLEYPEIREFVKTVPNVTWLRPGDALFKGHIGIRLSRRFQGCGAAHPLCQKGAAHGRSAT